MGELVNKVKSVATLKDAALRQKQNEVMVDLATAIENGGGDVDPTEPTVIHIVAGVIADSDLVKLYDDIKANQNNVLIEVQGAIWAGYTYLGQNDSSTISKLTLCTDDIVILDNEIHICFEVPYLNYNGKLAMNVCEFLIVLTKEAGRVNYTYKVFDVVYLDYSTIKDRLAGFKSDVLSASMNIKYLDPDNNCDVVLYRTTMLREQPIFRSGLYDGTDGTKSGIGYAEFSFIDEQENFKFTILKENN